MSSGRSASLVDREFGALGHVHRLQPELSCLSISTTPWRVSC